MFSRYQFVRPIFIFLTIALFVAAMRAQERPRFSGYVTAVDLPKSFDLNGQHMLITYNTWYAFAEGAGKLEKSLKPAMELIQIGHYLTVEVGKHREGHTLEAFEIEFHGDYNPQLSGQGVIEKVEALGDNRLIHADGYVIRETQATRVEFAGNEKALAGSTANDWVNYRGTLDANGVLVAQSLKFMPARAVSFKPRASLEMNRVQLSLDGPVLKPAKPPKHKKHEKREHIVIKEAASDTQVESVAIKKDGELKIGPRRYKIPADEALQARIIRIGQSLVPAYQKALPLESPFKIKYRFYAIDEPKVRGEICTMDGLIFVPRQLAERLPSDDQLAAVLANGVAFEMQRQAERLIPESRILTASEFSGDTAGVYVPGVELFPMLVETLATGKSPASLNEERGRMALSLMHDAGYDVTQAPEAWRLVMAKKTADAKMLKYPEYSGYQLGVIQLQYKDALKQPDAPVAASTATNN